MWTWGVTHCKNSGYTGWIGFRISLIYEWSFRKLEMQTTCTVVYSENPKSECKPGSSAFFKPAVNALKSRKEAFVRDLNYQVYLRTTVTHSQVFIWCCSHSIRHEIFSMHMSSIIFKVNTKYLYTWGLTKDVSFGLFSIQVYTHYSNFSF